MATTQKVKLRKLRATDAEELAALANNRKIWLNVRDRMPFPYLAEDAAAFIKYAHDMKGGGIFGIEVDATLVGAIGLHQNDDVYRYNYELGYWVGEPFWNKGYATKAMKLACKLGFEEFEANKICASVFDYNKASKHILTKFGFRQEGVFKEHVFKDGQFVDEHYFALSRSEYEKI